MMCFSPHAQVRFGWVVSAKRSARAGGSFVFGSRAYPLQMSLNDIRVVYGMELYCRISVRFRTEVPASVKKTAGRLIC